MPNYGGIHRIPNGSITVSNGSPNGSDFCKALQTRKVYGLTGKTTPGRLTQHNNADF